jgi:hypothetical protein
MNLGFFADWASILALLVTAFNAYQITNVKRRLVIYLTPPPLLDRLRDNSSEMNRFLLLFAASMDHFDGVIGICEVNVRAVRRRLGVRQSRSARASLIQWLPIASKKAMSRHGKFTTLCNR